MRRDSIFYQLFRRSPTLLFEFLPQQPARAEEYIFEAIEIKETGFRMDGVFLPPDPSGIVYFCEVQFQLDELLYERMNSEIGIYIYRHREQLSNWQAVVIYPSQNVEQSRIDTVQEMLASGRIQRVYLDELGEIETLPIGLSLMVLTTLEGERATAEARSLIKRAEGSRDIIDLVSTIIVYKFSNLSRDRVNAMLGIELEQTRVYLEAKAEGEILGEARGEARGEVKEAQSLIFRLLKRRVGNVSREMETKIESLPLARLEELHDAALDFTQIGDLTTWLDANG
jgi:predicted transposase/invertase (TIGR01784 family)